MHLRSVGLTFFNLDLETNCFSGVVEMTRDLRMRQSIQVFLLNYCFGCLTWSAIPECSRDYSAPVVGHPSPYTPEIPNSVSL